MNKLNELLPLTEAYYYILVALYQKPTHGYGIIQDTERMSSGRIIIGAGTLYTALNTLQKGPIEPFPVPEGTDTRRKMYAITTDGKTVVTAEIERLEELLIAGRNAQSMKKE
ncbi:PadR family transcriptional regulator [Paenibacillus mendelii]|uniref:PadR family transcriptional regulator n=1 Tax=Paenibacillus mendelii TaxID=206163 RepID=A0ABV6J486_9BACL|nr:PadR family transcriptional regulator [Paenibacillus mendelii]